MRIKPSQG